MNFETARHNMVEQQVRPWEVLDARVLDVLSHLHRENFVDDAHRNLAFADLCLPLAHGEVMMKPIVEGRVLQALALNAGDSVLEIGTGSGFLTACLARLAHEVVSVEQHADLAAGAQRRLQDAGIVNTRIEVAEAVRGFEVKREFDAVVITGAVSTLPDRFLRWLKPGGRMFVVQGASPAMQALLITRVADGRYDTESLFETDLPYLANAAPVQRFSL